MKGDKARLLALSERAKHLFGKEDLAPDAPKQKKTKTSKKQLGLFAEIEAAEKAGPARRRWCAQGRRDDARQGAPVDDLVRRWPLGGAEALHRGRRRGQGRALLEARAVPVRAVPADSEEKRWVDGVLAQEEGIGVLMITRFRAKNYGCLKNVEIDLTPVHAFIGPNDSGKSTLLRAVRALGYFAAGAVCA